MELVQDLVVGSVAGLALRGLKRVILGRKKDPTQHEVGHICNFIASTIEEPWSTPSIDLTLEMYYLPANR